ncbi:hypothetical protein A3Q56_04190 [Intoshia linei]|uniref:Uncharacterized protein n=1 Tax=Intoshia linei TaxID=1819745 RepID=A0A177B390_9BILA|nr:hypothetical protein A3Q56_04190 [Intoshia linei]
MKKEKIKNTAATLNFFRPKKRTILREIKINAKRTKIDKSQNCIMCRPLSVQDHVDFMTLENPSERFWKEKSEKLSQCVIETIEENEKLKLQNAQLKLENENLKETSKDFYTNKRCNPRRFRN